MPENIAMPPQQRLFFALWPSRGLQQALHLYARRQQEFCGGRLMRSEGLHMTLLFLGMVDAGRLQQLQQAAAGVQADAFDFTLARFLCWKHNHLGFAAPAAAVPELDALAGALRHCIAQAGFSFDRKPFAAHVTLLRKVERLLQPQDIPVLAWPVRDFALVVSETTPAGSRYRVLARWPLRMTAD